MADVNPNEIAALQASYRGALAAAGALAAMQQQVEALSMSADVDPALLDELGRLAAAQATASAALRGLIGAMVERRARA
jgi:hypothetical protein